MTLVLVVRLLVAWVHTLLCGAFVVATSFVLRPSYKSWEMTLRPWARGCLWLLGIRLHVSGQENLGQPAVYISNHESTVDIVFIPATIPVTTKYVAKKALGKIPLWGWGFARTGAILIDRSNPQQAIQSIRRALTQLPEGWSVAVFPEGTRNTDGNMRPFKKGAFHIANETGLPIVPIGMYGAREVVPKSGILIRPGQIWLEVGKPIEMRPEYAEDINAFVAAGRKAVQDCIEKARQRANEASPQSTHVSSPSVS